MAIYAKTTSVEYVTGVDQLHSDGTGAVARPHSKRVLGQIDETIGHVAARNNVHQGFLAFVENKLLMLLLPIGARSRNQPAAVAHVLVIVRDRTRGLDLRVLAIRRLALLRARQRSSKRNCEASKQAQQQAQQQQAYDAATKTIKNRGRR